MAISLFDTSCTSYLQILNATQGVLEKGKQHLTEQGVSLDDMVDFRLIEDMFPFRFQVISVVHHSMGSLKGIESGEFGPPNTGNYGEPDYEGLQSLLAEASDYVSGLTPDQVNGWEGKEMVFALGKNRIPFTAENFVQSFSIPNLMFHAATAYDMLRMKGVPLGKGDFLGQLRIGT